MYIRLLPFPCSNCGVPMCSANRTPPPGSHYLKHKGRKLCSGCYSVAWHSGTLDQFPTSNRSRAEMYRQWLELKELGVGAREAAQRLGMSYGAFDRMRHMGNAARRREEEEIMAKSHKDGRNGQQQHGTGVVVNTVEGEVTGSVTQMGASAGDGVVVNTVKGKVTGAVVQAHTIYGGIQMGTQGQ